MVLLQKGDHDALSELYHRYSTKLLSYFFKMLWKDEELAQDSLHDLFVKLIDKAYQFDTSRRFSTWLYSIAHNMCKNHYRKHEKLQLDSIDQIDSHTMIVSSEKQIDPNELEKALKNAMNNISGDHQSVFVLRYYENMSIKDIAEIMSCSEGTVKSRLFHAKKNLASQLKQFKEIDEGDY